MLWGPENGWPINRGQCRLQNGIYIFLKYCLKKLMTATCNVMVSCWIKYTKLARQWQALKPAKKSNTKMKGNQSTPNPTQVFLLHAKWLGNLPRRGREQYTTMFQALPTYLSIHLSIGRHNPWLEGNGTGWKTASDIFSKTFLGPQSCQNWCHSSAIHVQTGHISGSKKGWYKPRLPMCESMGPCQCIYM
jgi:hypothetical protein